MSQPSRKRRNSVAFAPSQSSQVTVSSLTRRIPRPVKKNTVSLGRQPIPQILKNTLKYTDIVDIGTAGGLGKYKFRATSLYDPDQIISGHQPLYFDQVVGLYNHFQVIRSRIKFTPSIPAASVEPVLFCVYTDDDATAVATAIVASERRGATYQMYSSGAGVPVRTLKQTYDAVKTFGPQALGLDKLIGSVSADPAEEVYFMIMVQDLAGLTTTFRCLVEVEYDVQWTELKDVIQS